MARQSSRAKKQQLKFILIGTVSLIAAITIIFAAAYFYWQRTPPADPITLCPADGPAGHYVLLIDKTDPLNFVQKQAFDVVLRDLIENRVPQGYLLSIFELNEDFTSSAQPLIQMCHPGTGAEASSLVSNVDKLKRQYTERFKSPVENILTSLVATKPANLSPIFEMLQLAAINGFAAHPLRGEQRLIIMSDMLHNTAEFSMYKSPTTFSEFEATPYGRKSLSRLKGVDVEIYYLMNAPKLQTRRQLKFWEEYFEQAGARIVSVTPLEG